MFKCKITVDLDKSPYKSTYAWLISNPIKYDKPIEHNHPMGAVIWVNV